MRFERALDEAAAKDHAPDEAARARRDGPASRGVAIWRRARRRRQGALRPGLGLDGRARRPAPRRRQSPPREAAVRSGRYALRDRGGARPWRGADARAACSPLARFRLAQSSRSAAGGRPQPSQRASGDRQHALRPSPAGARRRSAAAVDRLFGHINVCKR